MISATSIVIIYIFCTSPTLLYTTYSITKWGTKKIYKVIKS